MYQKKTVDNTINLCKISTIDNIFNSNPHTCLLLQSPQCVVLTCCPSLIESKCYVRIRCLINNLFCTRQ